MARQGLEKRKPSYAIGTAKNLYGHGHQPPLDKSVDHRGESIAGKKEKEAGKKG